MRNPWRRYFSMEVFREIPEQSRKLIIALWKLLVALFVLVISPVAYPIILAYYNSKKYQKELERRRQEQFNRLFSRTQKERR